MHWLLFTLLALLVPVSAGATTIVLSDLSSGETQAPAATLDGVMNLDVSGSNLIISIENTSAANTWDISEIFFNTSADILSIEGLTTPITGIGPQKATPSGIAHSVETGAAGTWDLFTSNFDGTNIDSVNHVGVFQVFDYGIKFKDGKNKKFMAGPGETVTFTLAFTCAGGATCDMADLGTELSQQSPDPGIWRAMAAAKFRGIEGGLFSNQSGFGASNVHLPEPSTALLVGLGLTALAARRRHLRN